MNPSLLVESRQSGREGTKTFPLDVGFFADPPQGEPVFYCLKSYNHGNKLQLLPKE